MRLVCIVGTRPEAVKLAPLVHELRNEPHIHTDVINSGQHGNATPMLLDELGVRTDEDLRTVTSGSLSEMTSCLGRQLHDSPLLRRADLVVVQGDTTTAVAGAMAAGRRGIPVAHVEAGLRSGDLRSPFPEERHRRTIAALASLHFAPTEHAGRNLQREGISAERIAVTGNTIVDALDRFHAPVSAAGSHAHAAPHTVLMTLHRRESWGSPLASLCDAVRDVVLEHADWRLVVPVHPNPGVAATVKERLGGWPRIELLPPLPYRAFVKQLRLARLIITDSGGVQEEAVTLGKRVLILRSVSDRPEGIWAGMARLDGVSPAEVRSALDEELNRHWEERPCRVYGDGFAAKRIVTALGRWREGRSPLLPPELEFKGDPFSETFSAGSRICRA
jgi:UDP-N-acetylglucosamine 2-epimerase (non-hydrolysing)